MLNYKPVTLKDKSLIDKYSFQYGGNSCQHSFASMYGHFEKYGDAFFEKDGWLCICRTHMNSQREKVYLCPMGDPADEEGFRQALQNLLADASSEGKRAVFHTVTSTAKSRMEKVLPGTFGFSAVRDYYEYIYSGQKLSELQGSKLATRRRQYRLFYRKYAGRVKVEKIIPEVLPEVLDFQSRWMKERMSNGGNPDLYEENRAIQREIGEYENLGLFGIIIRLDEKIAGYVYGVPLSDTCFDILCEKADRSIAYIYMALKSELPKWCDARFNSFNWEEDVGDSGLRTMKLRYYPDVLMEKFRAEELRSI